MNRREFLAAGAVVGLASVARGGIQKGEEGFDLVEVGITELQEGMAAGRWTAKGLVEWYLRRIEEIDRRGPGLNSVIEVNPEAGRIAEELDRERKEKGARGPLHGVPVLIKDNIDTADGMATTAGSLALVGGRPLTDAFLVKRLRKAGAVLLGKTNLSEWANARCSYSTSGWSGRGGLTKNPYALDRNPSGSSSGSGAAAAASLCAAAVGTETDGSILSPSSSNCLVGLKPTVGLVSRSGVIPISHSQDTAGPMCRSVRDAAILLTALAGRDMQDAASEPWPLQEAIDYTRALDANGLKGARIGVARNYLGTHERMDAVINEAVAAMARLGATMVDTTELPKGDQFSAAEETVFRYEMKAGLNKYLARLGPGAKVKSVEEIVAFNKKNAEKELKYFGQDSFEKMAAKGGLESYEYQEALAKCRRVTRTEGIDAVFDKLKLDAIVGPCGGVPWATDLVCGDRFVGNGDAISIAAVAGYPSVTVPAGFVWGLPIGVCIFGRAWTEEKLLKYAYAFEQGTKVRRGPRFLERAEIK